jgi:hypothetical protein
VTAGESVEERFVAIIEEDNHAGVA